MSEYRQLHRRFWDSDYVEDELDEDGTLIYLYLITCPKSNMEGLYKCSMNRICRQTKIDRETVQKWLSRLERDGYAGWLKGWVCVTQACNHMPRSPQMMTHAKKLYSDVPEDIMVWAINIGYRLPDGLDTVSIPYRTRLDDTTQNETDENAVSGLLSVVGLAPNKGAGHGHKE